MITKLIRRAAGGALLFICACTSQVPITEYNIRLLLPGFWSASYGEGKQYLSLNENGSAETTWYAGGCIPFEPVSGHWVLTGNILRVNFESVTDTTYRIMHISKRNLVLEKSEGEGKIKYKRVSSRSALQ